MLLDHVGQLGGGIVDEHMTSLQGELARPGEGAIVGDLPTVTPRELAEMDEIESHPFPYVRTRVAVESGSGPVVAGVFWAPEDPVNGARLIESGDWFARERGGF